MYMYVRFEFKFCYAPSTNTVSKILSFQFMLSLLFFVVMYFTHIGVMTIGVHVHKDFINHGSEHPQLILYFKKYLSPTTFL